MIQGNALFGRAYLLTVSNTKVLLDLSALHFKFTVKSADVQTPNSMTVRVYNLSTATATRIKSGEFTKVTLSAGYQAQANYGQIFTGDIKHIHAGRENNVDSYVELLAGDGESLYNFARANTTVAAGASPADIFNALSKVVTDFGVAVDPRAPGVFNSMGGIIPRGAVVFGLFRTEMTNLCNATNVRWSIRQGQLIVVPNTSYLPGTIVKLNSMTGLVGVPEVTDNGINIRMLLNGIIQIGGQVQINQSDINTQIVQQQGYPNYGDVYYPAITTTDGVYRVVVLNHTGDTRGQPWYTDIVGLAINDGVVQQYPGSANAVEGAALGAAGAANGPA